MVHVHSIFCSLVSRTILPSSVKAAIPATGVAKNAGAVADNITETRKGERDEREKI